jgi:two-component system, OmpR family, KDP operon response regulator KdpE
MQHQVWNSMMMVIAEKSIVKGRSEGAVQDDIACADFRVLVIEDEVRLRKLLVRELSAEGFEVWEAVDGKSGLQMVAGGPNLVLLDLRLPDMDGLQVLRAVRRMRDNLPIVVLSRVGDEDAKVAALDAGADDYVMKPFGIKELLARIRVAFRHRGLSPTDNRLLSVGDLVLDVEERTVKVRKKELRLSGKECQLLHGLLRNAGKALSHEFLLKEFWGEETDPQLLRVFIRSLRQKIEADPANPKYILTVRGIGYRFRASD